MAVGIFQLLHEKAELLKTKNDPRYFTAAHWMVDDAKERKRRFVNLDFENLKRTVISLSEKATAIVKWESLDRGFNRVFKFELDNEETLYAKFPTSVVGPRQYIVNSEVATMKYLQKHTALPIPQVLDWDDASNNPINAEYIITAGAVGMPLEWRWQSQPKEYHEALIKDTASLYECFDKLNLPGYGSIYFSKLLPTNCPRIKIDEEFCIGPSAFALFELTGKDVDFLHIKSLQRYVGPWKTSKEFSLAAIDRGRKIAELSKIPKERAAHKGTKQELFALLDRLQALVEEFFSSPAVQLPSQPILLHPDLSPSNTFVGKTGDWNITGIIDWQWASIEPSFIWQYKKPFWLTAYASQVRQLHYPSLLASADEQIAAASPKLSSIISHPGEAFLPFFIVWDVLSIGVTQFTKHILAMCEFWDTVSGKTEKCVFELTDQELKLQAEREEDMMEELGLQAQVLDYLEISHDGWVSTHRWKSVQLKYQTLLRFFKENLKKDREQGTRQKWTKEYTRSIWPFPGRYN
ncbi:hypothetical protein BT63DRAFT_271673 [Microthyrium microscopicum]|uniref:Altered inheritance of mitochondria protein 9, mitochondrial n=1 Tax=Microthyrium microscopicum TaxID=703497 RepID=A0A6A6U7I8_9PEZI|nr:hypothetical protein BT63DRAFT_271673 [Microthyrium microscopicum]